MGKEIEKKFLVIKDKWDKVEKTEFIHIRQGYILNEISKSIRVRMAETVGYITIKGKTTGASRDEYEYIIPENDAERLLEKFTVSVLSKIRYKIEYQHKLWEVDVFLEDNAGLIIAEIELESENEKFEIPEWIDKEVTSEKKYYNSNLSLYPFKNW